jgi:hypothetical protein
MTRDFLEIRGAQAATLRLKVRASLHPAIRRFEPLQE